MSSISEPIKIMIAVLVGLVVAGVAAIALAATGVGGSDGSTALTSTASTFTNILPFIGIIVAAGFFMIAIGSRR